MSTLSPTCNVPSPPPQISAVAGAGAVPGWSRYIASNPDLQYTFGRWFLLKSTLASGGSYMYTADSTAMVMLPFDGAGIRIRYVAFPLFGVFEGNCSPGCFLQEL